MTDAWGGSWGTPSAWGLSWVAVVLTRAPWVPPGQFNQRQRQSQYSLHQLRDNAAALKSVRQSQYSLHQLRDNAAALKSIRQTQPMLKSLRETPPTLGE